MMGRQLLRVQRAREARRRLKAAAGRPRKPAKRWDVRARAPTAQRLQVEAALVALGFTIDPRPPAAGPELEARFSIWAASEDGARAAGRRRLERQGVTVLAIAARRAPR